MQRTKETRRKEDKKKVHITIPVIVCNEFFPNDPRCRESVVFPLCPSSGVTATYLCAPLLRFAHQSAAIGTPPSSAVQHHLENTQSPEKHTHTHINEKYNKKMAESK